MDFKIVPCLAQWASTSWTAAIAVAFVLDVALCSIISSWGLFLLRYICPTWAIWLLQGNIDPVLTGSTLTRNVLMANVRKAVLNANAGVHVICAPAQSGKSTALAHALSTLYNENLIRGVIHLNGKRYTDLRSPLTILSWIASLVDISWKPTHFSVEDVFTDPSRPSVLLLDQFELVLDMQNFEDIRKMIHSIAVSSSDRKTFVVLIATTSQDDYKKIVTWNGGEKIKSIDSVIWRPAELQSLVNNYTQAHICSLTSHEKTALGCAISSNAITNVGQLQNYLGRHNLYSNPPPVRSPNHSRLYPVVSAHVLVVALLTVLLRHFASRMVVPA